MSEEEARRYRATLSLSRMVEEIWIVIALLGFIPLALRFGAVAGFTAFMATGLMCYFGLPKVLLAVMPQHVRVALPRGQFEGPVSPASPRGWFDLVRLWRNPSWRCPEQFQHSPNPAPLRAKLAISVGAVLCVGTQLWVQYAVIRSLSLAPQVRQVATVIIGATVLILILTGSHVAQRFVRVRWYTTPARGEIQIVALITCLCSLAASGLALVALSLA